MRLLVSVRSEEEVAAALAGGADIIDAKDPERGPLGPVTPAVLRAISASVPDERPFSIALGDVTGVEAVREAISAARIARGGPVYLKLGFTGEPSRRTVEELIGAAQEAAGDGPGRPVFVPVAYADWRKARSASPEDVLHAAIARRAEALLVDTCTKDGRGLLDFLPLARVRALADASREAGLEIALAGSLDLPAVERLAGIADVLGVRGAACVGGRNGRLDADRIRLIRARMGDRSPADPESASAGHWQNARARKEIGLPTGSNSLL